MALPGHHQGSPAGVRKAIYADPADPPRPEEWRRQLGMSWRTLGAALQSGTGYEPSLLALVPATFQGARVAGRRPRVMQTALELSYGSASAFIYAFRIDGRCSVHAPTCLTPGCRGTSCAVIRMDG